MIDRATPELVAAVEQGAVKVSQAAQLADADPAYQLGVLGKVQVGLPVMEAKRRLKRETLKTAPFPDRKYRVLYSDCPWLYGNDLARHDRLDLGGGSLSAHVDRRAVRA